MGVSISPSLSSIIRSRRRELGLSLRELGATSGLHYSWLSKLESGRTSEALSAASLAGLAKALVVPMSRLLAASGFDSQVILPGFEEFLSQRYPKLDSARRKALLQTFTATVGAVS